jgi:NADH:ubiquinone oxidoreductase subunit C
VEPATLIQKLNDIAPGAILEKQRFGRSGALSVWIEVRAIQKIAEGVRHAAGLELDWLENLSVMQLDEALVLSYFVRSTTTDERVILRGSVVPPSINAEVKVPSVVDVWEMAAPMQEEIAELFGVRFSGGGSGSGGDGVEARGSRLPEGWRGFPLRKGYVFPTEVLNIPHRRSAAGSPDAPEPSERRGRK